MKLTKIFLVLFLFTRLAAAQSLPSSWSGRKISALSGSFTGILEDNDNFGYAIANIGDFDGDGIAELAVGANGDDDGNDNRGAVWILFLNADGTVKSHQKIVPATADYSGASFGSALANLGDLDGDGTIELAVGAAQENVLIVSLNSDDATAASYKKIGCFGSLPCTEGGFSGNLTGTDSFGCSLANVGDLDGDTVTDLAVGAYRDGLAGNGAVWILFLNADGTVKDQQKIANGEGGLPDPGWPPVPLLKGSDYFGQSVANLGDLNADGITDLAIGAFGDDDGASGAGAVWILFLNNDGTVASYQKISATQGGFTGSLESSDYLGYSAADTGDLDGDGLGDLLSGALYGGVGGAVWGILINADGTVKNQFEISTTAGTFTGSLDGNDRFGRSIARLGDLDGDGITELAVGAIGDDDGGSEVGAVWILFSSVVIAEDQDLLQFQW